jgi:hypothetical protein
MLEKTLNEMSLYAGNSQEVIVYLLQGTELEGIQIEFLSCVVLQKFLYPHLISYNFSFSTHH